MPEGSFGGARGNKQLPQPLQREATPPPRGPTWATDPFWLRDLAKCVAAGNKKKRVYVLYSHKEWYNDFLSTHRCIQ